MQITKTCIFNGKTRTRELNVTQEQIDAWENGALIQNVMPHLIPEDREFLITGLLPEEFEAMFGEEE